MSEFLQHTGCSECGSTDNRAVYVQEVDGKNQLSSYCFGCEVSYGHDKTTEALGTVIDIDNYTVDPSTNVLTDKDHADIKRVLEYKSTHWQARRLKNHTCQRYNVRTKWDGDVVTHRYYPSTFRGELVGFHVRDDQTKQARKTDKSIKRPPFYPIGKVNKTTELFGQCLFPKGGKYIVITGGEEDALAVYQALKSDGYETPVVSSTIGETATYKQIQSNYEYINSFDNIVLMMDNDDAGKKACQKITKMFGYGKVLIADLIYNDPCEYYKKLGGTSAGDAKAVKGIKKAFWDAMPKKPSQVLTVKDIFEKAMKLPEMGLSFPWPSATKVTLGIRRGEIHICGAAPKIGKTEHQHQLIKHMTDVHNMKVGVMSLEENPVKTLKKVGGKYANRQFTKPPEVGGYTLQEMNDTFTLLQDKIEFYSSDGVRDADEILSTMRYWASKGIWFFIIDPLTALVAEHTSGEANDILNNFMSKASQMCMELQITMFMYSHVNPVKSGTPHDQGGDVLSSQFTGSRAMEKWAHYGWGIQRNRNEKDPVKRNTARVTLLFDREFGEFCEYYAFYDTVRNDWSEIEVEEEGDDNLLDDVGFLEIPIEANEIEHDVLPDSDDLY